MCDHRFISCFSPKQQPIIRLCLPLDAVTAPKQWWPSPSWDSWTSMDEVKVPCVVPNCIPACLIGVFSGLTPKIRQMQNRKEANSKEEPHSLILGEGSLPCRNGGIKSSGQPPFIFLNPACSNTVFVLRS